MKKNMYNVNKCYYKADKKVLNLRNTKITNNNKLNTGAHAK